MLLTPRFEFTRIDICIQREHACDMRTYVYMSLRMDVACTSVQVTPIHVCIERARARDICIYLNKSLLMDVACTSVRDTRIHVCIERARARDRVMRIYVPVPAHGCRIHLGPSSLE